MQRQYQSKNPVVRRGLFLFELRIYKLEFGKEGIGFPNQHRVCRQGRRMNRSSQGFNVCSVLGQAEQTYKQFGCIQKTILKLKCSSLLFSLAPTFYRLEIYSLGSSNELTSGTWQVGVRIWTGNQGFWLQSCFFSNIPELLSDIISHVTVPYPIQCVLQRKSMGGEHGVRTHTRQFHAKPSLV